MSPAWSTGTLPYDRTRSLGEHATLCQLLRACVVYVGSDSHSRVAVLRRARDGYDTPRYCKRNARSDERT